MAIMETVLEIPAEHERNIFGNFDSNIKKIEKNLNVTMVARDGNLKLVGDSANVKQAESILMELLDQEKVVSLFQKDQLRYYVMRIVRNNLQSCTSRFFYRYRRFSLLNSGDKALSNYGEEKM